MQALGQRSTHWTPEIFWQLLRSAAATPKSLIQTYYNTYVPLKDLKFSHKSLLDFDSRQVSQHEEPVLSLMGNLTVGTLEIDKPAEVLDDMRLLR